MFLHLIRVRPSSSWALLSLAPLHTNKHTGGREGDGDHQGRPSEEKEKIGKDEAHG